MNEILKIIVDFLLANPIYIVTTLIFMTLIPLNDIYTSRLYGNLFETIQKNTFTMKDFTKILGVTSFIQVGYALMDLNDSKQIPLFQQYCKEKFIKNIFEKHKSNFKELLTGDLLSKILRSQHIITAWYSRLTTFIIPHIFEFGFSLGYFLWFDYILGTSFGLLLAIFIIVLVVSPSKSNDDTIRSDKSLNNLHEQIDDLLTNYLSVHKEDKLNYELERLRDHNNKFMKHYNNTVKTTLKYRLFLTALLIAFLFVFIYRSYLLLKSKKMKKSSFYSLVMIITHMMGSLLWMIDTARDVIFDYGTIKNSEFLSEPSSKQNNNMVGTTCVDLDTSIRRRTSGKTPGEAGEKEEGKDGFDRVLVIENVHFKYVTQRHNVLSGVNIEINRGDKVAIVGHIGSGKSTLIKIMLRLLKPTKGHVYLFGKCATNYDNRTFYRHVGLMPQNCVLFNRPIIENIKYDNAKVTDSMIYEAIHRFGIIDHFSNLKNGLESLAGKNGMNLSGGQRQLVWFLKLYFKNPEIIIMDEPTASLDKETKDLFIDIMGTILKNKTIIMVTHDNYVLKFANRLMHMKNGKTIEAKQNM